MAGDRIEARLAIIGRHHDNPALDAWAERFLKVEHYPTGQWIAFVTARNRAIRDFLKTSKLTRLFLADSDVVPGSATEQLLDSTAAVAYAVTAGGNGQPMHAGAFCLGLAACRREPLEIINPPWCGFELTADGCAVARCPCTWLEDRLRQAGFRPAAAGVAGHLREIAVWPADRQRQ